MKASVSLLKRQIRRLILLFILCLLLSGITAFPIETELNIAMQHLDSFPPFLQKWLSIVYKGVSETNRNYPFISYGSDWLAFAHIVIAVAFLGPLKDPVRNIWIIQFGMIACVMIIPLALIAGPSRGIPLFWQFIDCSFGVIGYIPLYICHNKIRELEFKTRKSQN